MQTTIPLELQFIGLNYSFEFYVNSIDKLDNTITFPNLETNQFFFEFFNVFSVNTIIKEDKSPLLQVNCFPKYTKNPKENLNNFVNKGNI